MSRSLRVGVLSKSIQRVFVNALTKMSFKHINDIV